MVNYDSEEGFTVHMEQHAKNDAKEVNPFPAIDKYICLYVFALQARASEQLVQHTRLCA